MLRFKYLKHIKAFRNEGRPIIVYTDESYIHTNHVQKKSWTKNSNSGIMQNLTKGVRVIIVHAGSSEGFIPNALLTYRA